MVASDPVRGHGRRRAAWVVGGVALIVLLVSTAVVQILPHRGSPNRTVALPIAPTCPFTPLVLPNGYHGSNARAYWIDPSGRYVVGGYDDAGQSVQVLWVDGVPTPDPVRVGGPARNLDIKIDAVGSDGTLAGSILDNNQSFAFRWRAGRLTRLSIPEPAGWSVQQVYMDYAGDLLTTAADPDEAPMDGVTIIWPAGENNGRIVPQPANVFVYGLGTGGTIVGVGGIGSLIKGAYATDSTGGDLHPLLSENIFDVSGDWAENNKQLINIRTGTTATAPLPPGYEFSQINVRGWATINNPVGGHNAMLYHNGTLSPLAHDADDTAWAEAVSEYGLVIGQLVHTGAHSGAMSTVGTWRC